jgi:hypothetical protein
MKAPPFEDANVIRLVMEALSDRDPKLIAALGQAMHILGASLLAA